jgi:flagellar hook-associated protein 2
MSDILNLNNITVDDSGRVTVSGLSSGIDIHGTVDSIIQARRIPIDNLEIEVEENQLKIDAYEEFELLLAAFNDASDALSGGVSFGGTSDIFESKSAFAAAGRLDGGTASDPSNLIGVTVTNSALTGSHSIEVLQTARAHKIGSGDFNSLSDDLGTATGGAANSVSGDFTINGVQIDVQSSDTLKDLRDRINNANTGDNATGVSASIVSVSETEHILILTAEETGTSSWRTPTRPASCPTWESPTTAARPSSTSCSRPRPPRSTPTACWTAATRATRAA